MIILSLRRENQKEEYNPLQVFFAFNEFGLMDKQHTQASTRPLRAWCKYMVTHLTTNNFRLSQITEVAFV